MSAAASTSAAASGPSLPQSTNPSAPPSKPPSIALSNTPSNPKSLTALSATLPHTSSPLPHSPETMRQIQESRAALLAQMNSVGQSATASIQERAHTLHGNSQQLGKQEKELAKATEGLRKESARLEKVVREGGRRVKELGNVQNWAEVLEREFLVLGETLRLAEGGSEYGSEGSWTGSSWSGSEDGGDGGEGGEEERDDEGGKSVKQEDGRALDGEGDVDMGVLPDGQEALAKTSDMDLQTDIDGDKGKGKQDVEIAESMHLDQDPGTTITGVQIDHVGGSSTATIGSGSLSASGTGTTQQSGSSSIHTTHSVTG